MENEKVEENKSNSAAAAREARRRRILENSNNRLGKITGRVHDEEIPKIETLEPNGIYDDPELERDVFEGPRSMQSFNSNSNQDVFELLKTLQENKTNDESPKQQELPQNPFSKFIKSKYPVIFIALLVYTLFALNCESLIGRSVFSLFIAWEVLSFILTTFIFREPVQQNQITVLISMFLGLNANSLNIFIKILGLFNKILRDIAIFLFTFVLYHVFYSFLIIGESMSEILDKDFNRLLRKDEL